MPAKHFCNERAAMVEWQNVEWLVVTESLHFAFFNFR
jgi:hypothetical protein